MSQYTITFSLTLNGSNVSRRFKITFSTACVLSRSLINVINYINYIVSIVLQNL